MASVRVAGTGLRYGSPAEAFADADEIERQADAEAESHREEGNEAAADRAVDRGHALAEKIRAHARDAEAKAARATPQPPGRPTRRASASPSRRRGRRERSGGGLGELVGASRRDVRGAARTLHVEGPITGTADLFMTGLGALLMLVLGYVLVNEKGRGPQTVQAFVGGLQHGVKRVLDPSDPLLFGGAPAKAQTVTTGTLGATIGPTIGGLASGFLPRGALYKPGRADQGRDFQTNPGGAILAPGAGKVVAVRSDPSGFGPAYPVVRFSSGPYAGHTLYIGHTIAALKAGASFRAGQVLSHTGTKPVGNATKPGWAEIGYAPGGVPGRFGQKVPF